ncbi:putative phosphorylase superfamily protein [Colletotrichum scovillei]|uniref:putative phosphorylase superfamily protein n=1 Tax=Colletotrichum scovillei TaxID=1209932 RepID=UPI0015C3834D|nr:putative phosphorylase superfamily protein [Colletotrichum scovillei]KAF4772744.1 putative phosphorylase superfamily protein [Colletotrichum scovillei]
MGLTRLLKKINCRKDGSAVASSTPQPEAPCAPQVRPFGLEVLVEGTDPVVDIVAVHGLNGHREHTWTASGGKHWLRDFLPTDLPNARVLCWGYDANTHSNSGVSIQYLYDHARELVADLARKRGLTKVCSHLAVVSSENTDSNQSRERPIIFVVHSLGGIVVKSALIHSDTAREGALAEHRSIKTSTHGILFMGTLIKEVVPRASAVVPGQTDGEPIAIHADHINMVKFAFKEDSNYVKVLEVLQIMVADACSNIQSRWETEERVTRARIGHKILEKKSGPFYSIPFPDNKGFVGRSETLQVLHSMLFHDHCQSVALCGLGGIGKTQVALKLAYLIKEGRPEYSIFWVPASSKETFNEAYLAVAKKLGVHATDNEDLRLALMHHLRSSASGKWLLIIDNADDEDVLYGSQDGSDGVLDYLPQSEAGVTLFTTRFSRIATSVATENVIDLANMSFDEAHSFMRHSLVKGLYEEGNVLNELLEDLTYLPLAIAQSAAYMNENRTSMREYLDLLRNTEQDMIELLSSKFHDRTRYRNKDSQHPVATTWFLSFSKIHKDHPQAASLLMFLSCIEPKGIPRSILPKLPSEQQLTAAIGTLCAYAFLTQRGNCSYRNIMRLRFLTQRGNAKVHDMHRLKEYMPHALHLLNGKDLDAVGMGIELSDCANFDDRWAVQRGHKNGRVKDSIAALEPVVEVYGRRSTEDTLTNLHRDEDSQRHTMQTRLKRRHLTKIIRLDFVAILTRNASAYRGDGRVKDAIDLLENVVEVRKTTLDEGHPRRLATEGELAEVYRVDGRVNEAIELLEHVVKVRKTTLDEGHPDRLASQGALADAYLADGRVKDAIELLEYVVEMHRKTLDEGHYHRLTSQHSLAMAYQADGRVKDATKLLEHVVEIEETTLDKGHHNRLASQGALADAYLADGRVKDAIELLEYVVEMHRKTLDEGHYYRLTSQHSLAMAYQADGRVKDATKLLEHVVEIEETTLDKGHPARLASQCASAKANEAGKECRRS